MATKDRKSHDQKRKEKLAKRAERLADHRDVTPYTGAKYQKQAWVPQVYETELAVYETILASNQTLTNDHVWRAFVRLIKDLRSGAAQPLADDAPKMALAAGFEVDYLIWNIHRHW